jgi:hypothetical protein
LFLTWAEAQLLGCTKTGDLEALVYPQLEDAGREQDGTCSARLTSAALLRLMSLIYNELRTHLSLGKDAPIHRPIHRIGRIMSVPVLGGLHHQYCRT